MAGADQSKNLGGMLSQMGASLGSMGGAGEGLLRPIENTFRPQADPEDLGSMQNLMQWQQKMGREDAARTTMAGIKDLRAKEEKSKQEMYARMNMGLANAYQQADPAKREEILKRAGQLSQETGQDFMSGLYAIDGQQRAQDQAARAAASAAQRQQDAARAKRDGEIRAQWLNADEAQKEKLVEEMTASGMGGTLMVLQNHDRSVQDWNEAKDQKAMVPVTAGERKVIDKELTELTSSLPKVGERFRSAIEEIEKDTELSNTMKRQKIEKMLSSARQMNLQNEEAAAKAAAKAAKETDESGLKAPPAHMFDENSVIMETIKNADRGISILWTDSESEAAKLNDAIEDAKGKAGGVQDLARRAAAYMTTYPQLRAEDALSLAASGGSIVSEGKDEDNTGGPAGSSFNNPIVLD